MTDMELRTVYEEEILPPLILENPEEFYGAFEQGPEALTAFFEDKWRWMCRRLGQEERPFGAGMDVVALNDTPESFAGLACLELPETAPPVGVLYAAISFGVAGAPRLFFGEYARLRSPGDTVAVFEAVLGGDGMKRVRRSVLYQGCNNEPLLFPAPARETPVDRDAPLPREEWYTAFLDAVARRVAGRKA